MRIVTGRRLLQTVGLIFISVSLADLLVGLFTTRDPSLLVWLCSGLLGSALVIWASKGCRRLALTGLLLSLVGIGAPALYARIWFIDNGKSLRLILMLFFLWHVGLVTVAVAGVNWLYDSFRVTPGLCRECGYDLRGNASGRCSECGQVFAHEQHQIDQEM